jgi:DNA-nicking Smr family endonuclease
MSGRRDDPFHNPFRDAKPELKRRLEQWRREQQPAAALPPDPPAPVADDEERSFARAMSGVAPLPGDDRVGPRRGEVAPRTGADADAEAYAVLADLVAGHGEFDISDSVEYVEGVAPGVDKRLLKQLRRGDFALQGHLDLHGLTRSEARCAVEGFIAESRARGRRCVLLIHGRGLNSPDRVPVLKNALVAWLTRGSLAKRILAFATSRPADGGAGALYVLLRK